MLQTVFLAGWSHVRLWRSQAAVILMQQGIPQIWQMPHASFMQKSKRFDLENLIAWPLELLSLVIK